MGTDLQLSASNDAAAPSAAAGLRLVQRYPGNDAGRDFVVGDVHGCFDLLRDALDAAGFSKTRDRLFSVGDLVDRGSASIEAVDWLAQPWFHAVRGNHEQAAIRAAAGRGDFAKYVNNGGGWFLDLPERQRRAIALTFGALPVAIEVECSDRLVGIVHAGVPNDDWRALVATLNGQPSGKKLQATFSFTLHDRTRFEARATKPVRGADLVFVGHSAAPNPSLLGNVAFIDTGAVFGGKLTVAEIAQWLLPSRRLGVAA